jgi:AhpD family alkylhydroperoxidase
MATARTYDEMETDLEETFGLVPAPLDSIPEDDAVAEWPTFKKYTVGESEIPPKYRELMGLAVAANIKCPYCTHFHREAARMHGATDDELAEAYSLASFTARYSAMLHAQSYDLDTFEREFEQMATHLQANMEAGDD